MVILGLKQGVGKISLATGIFLRQLFITPGCEEVGDQELLSSTAIASLEDNTNNSMCNHQHNASHLRPLFSIRWRISSGCPTANPWRETTHGVAIKLS